MSFRRFFTFEEVFNLAWAKDPLVDGQSCAKLFVHTNLDSIEKLQYICLTVVGDEVVSRLPFSNTLDYRFTYSRSLSMDKAMEDGSTTYQLSSMHRH